jgi:hypothetical protein
MANLQPLTVDYSQFVTDVKAGKIKIPQFQRQFVWDMKASAKLLDSMIKGYPIGTFILWRTGEELRAVRNVGNLSLPEQQVGELVSYVLDGQQRITSFYAAVEGAKVPRENGRIEDFSAIMADLSADEDAEIVTIETAGRPADALIPFTTLLNGSLRSLNSFPEIYHDRIDQYKKRINGWKFSISQLNDAGIEVATEVFTRLNVGGKELTLFEIMVAKTFRAPRQLPNGRTQPGFDLAESFNRLLLDLIPVKYETISSATVLQIMSVIYQGGCTRKLILSIPKDDFIATWHATEQAIKTAVAYFRSYGIPVSRLLPYNALLVPFSYFFIKHTQMPTGQIQKRLEDFFWRCSLGARYSSAVESKLANDIQKIDAILNDNQPFYEWSVDVSPNGLFSQGWFGTGRSFIKAILALYAMQSPKSFASHLNVNIDNSWLIKSTSRNYHHFFPTAYMRRRYPNLDPWQYNHILNITIVDDYLNKRIIRDRAPSDYMADIARENPQLDDTLQTHLIGPPDQVGIATDDYDLFKLERAKWVSKALNSRLIPQTTGQEAQSEVLEEEEVILT